MKTAAKHGKIIMAEQSTDGMCSCIFSIPLKVMMYMREIMGGGGGGLGSETTTLENNKSICFHRNTSLDPLENHKFTQPAFNVGPSLVCQYV